MNRYETKPQEVEAVQYTGGNRHELLEFAGDKVSWDPGGFAYLLSGPDFGNQSWQALPPGYWVVRNPSDARNYWQLSTGYFEGQYQPMQGAERDEPEPGTQSSPEHEPQYGPARKQGRATRKGAKKAAPKAAEPEPPPEEQEAEAYHAEMADEAEQAEEGYQAWREGYL